MMQTLEFRAMNTQVLMAAEGFEWAVRGLQEARSLIEDSERRFSRFVEDSELSRLNASAGRWFDVSQDMLNLLRLALSLHIETEGLFDPAILPNLKRLGYDRSMDEIRAQGALETGSAIPLTGGKLTQIELDFEHLRVRLPVGMELDLGGIAKGWIVREAADLLHCHTTACAVSAGGDIVFKGRPIEGTDWPVRIEDPVEPERSVAILRVGPSAVATSSVVKRSWDQGGIRRHHLVDPRTGESAATEWLSVTVIAPDISVAEVYAKALLIGGRTIAPRLSARRPEITYFGVAPDRTISSDGAAWREMHEYSFASPS